MNHKHDVLLIKVFADFTITKFICRVSSVKYRSKISSIMEELEKQESEESEFSPISVLLDEVIYSIDLCKFCVKLIT